MLQRVHMCLVAPESAVQKDMGKECNVLLGTAQEVLAPKVGLDVVAIGFFFFFFSKDIH